MKPSLLLVSGVLAWTLPQGAARPALSRPPDAPAPGPAVGLNVALERVTRLVEQGRVEAAWREFAPLRGAALSAPPASAPGENLEPALLELGRAFLLWENPEAALDAWHVAAQRGSRAARERMAESLGKKGWPYWLDARALGALPAKTEWLPEVPFRHAALAEEASPTAPEATDPLYRSIYRYGIAVYAPDLLHGGRKAEDGGPKVEGGGEKLPPVSGYVYQRFHIHYQQPEHRGLALKLARNFAALYPLMRGNLGRHTRFEENGLIHVWLVSEGDAGGEQWQGHLYFYDLERPRSNLEWMREAAHEYGHTGLPGMSGFTQPEGWADGELGERLLLRWLAPSWSGNGGRGSGIGTGALEALGLKESGVEAYRANYVRPLVAQVAANGWRPALAAERDATSMDHVMGLALWAEEVHGTPFLREMLDRVPNEAPTGIWAGYHRAVAERLRPVRTGSKTGGGAKPPPLTVAPAAGRLRFYVPMAGTYRLTWIGGRKEPVPLVPEGPGVRASSPKGKGPSVVKIAPGQSWAAKPGWYRVAGPPGILKIERA